MNARRREYLRSYGNHVISTAKVRITREDDGTEVQPGDTVTDFRGATHTLRRATRFRSPELGKTGKVVVGVGNGHDGEYYDSVFGLRVELVIGETVIPRRAHV